MLMDAVEDVTTDKRPAIPAPLVRADVSDVLTRVVLLRIC